MTTPSERDVNEPFVLTCLECDAGEECGSMTEAIAAGWTRLYDDPTGVSWTAVGLCPRCELAGRQSELF